MCGTQNMSLRYCGIVIKRVNGYTNVHTQQEAHVNCKHVLFLVSYTACCFFLCSVQCTQTKTSAPGVHFNTERGFAHVNTER